MNFNTYLDYQSLTWIPRSLCEHIYEEFQGFPSKKSCYRILVA